MLLGVNTRTNTCCVLKLVIKSRKVFFVFACVRKRRHFLVDFQTLQKANISFITSVRPNGTSRLPLDDFFYEASYLRNVRKSVEKIHLRLKSDKSNGYCTLRHMCTVFVIISVSVLLRMRTVLGKSCRENQNTYFIFNIFFSENRAFYEIMWNDTKCIVACPLQ
jgi:hypothetical protein